MERKNTNSIEHAFDDEDVDKAVIGADDTGILAGEQSVVETEIDEALEGSDGSGA